MAFVVYFKESFIFYYLCLLLWVACGNAELCTMKGPCRCEYDNGTIVDLSSNEKTYSLSFSEKFTNSEKSGWMTSFYYFHPCKNFNFTMADSNINKCGSSSLCKRIIQFAKSNDSTTYTINDGGYQNIGSVESSKMVGSDNVASIVYGDPPIITTIMLLCVQNGEALTVTDSDPSVTVLRFFSPLACGFATHTNQHSLGTTLLIIFFVMALVYLLLGALVKHFLMGAQGIEVIPNLSFWKELPNLVKDGVAFLLNGCKPPPQSTSTPTPNSNPNSYDSI